MILESPGSILSDGQGLRVPPLMSVLVLLTRVRLARLFMSELGSRRTQSLGSRCSRRQGGAGPRVAPIPLDIGGWLENSASVSQMRERAESIAAAAGSGSIKTMAAPKYQVKTVVTNHAKRPVIVYRHAAMIRLTHWVGVVCVTLLLLSGLQIFNAHPALYLGQASDFRQPIASIGAGEKDTRQIGATKIFEYSFNTTGFLGLSGSSNDDQRAFPAWLTLPGYQDLAAGRRWHFFFAWLLFLDALIYLIYSIVSGHVWRDLVPSAGQLRHIGTSILDHLRLRFPRGEESRHYNVLQRLTYLVILFILVPLLILTGLTMSPGLDAAFPFLTDALGGRQTARTIHFICAFTLVGFAIIHVVMVLLSGVWNNMRSMITGWYVIKPETHPHGQAG
jgi:thiosulfate reductase cytochrome b subunit